ncbi:MAG TPA: GGDEF domain-containing protein [Sulfurimonas sp.]|nr:GGDEF domain-containing protein [Sulfurimonas sp.]
MQDKVLIKVAQVLKNNIRSTDIIFRWEGEEFIVLSLKIDIDNINMLCEHIRHTIEQTAFDTIDPIILSIGAIISTDIDNVSSIIKRADDALYLAKNEGRNCVTPL